ncbi:glutamine amidotransferase [Methanobrevibacter millerae]|uniref:glutamine--fructose-6-phosphate transaminase (isomerizing) n=1 Tax=Methanobrevibacter millerae TaxID=230361 RepID=A0A0U3E8E1_9EURY|nr:glutamine amidotransferase [Methanobrevibacter millerae]ALT69232.1 glutamine amidotransferase [Methanobrevibacter millerae]MBO6109420.1 glutamine amidotransferase [Methanobrevibacter sp.]MBO6275599.1 glutamine amidotransferase [Methanobrevibacter sp.]
MCGIAGVIYKDKKTHPVGDALTSMLESLQHRGPDSAGYAIYGSLNFPENYYQLNIEVKRRKGTLDNLKSLLNQISPIYKEQLVGSVGDSDVYKCKIALDEYSLLQPCIREIDELENVNVINGSHSFEMIKDIGKVKDIAERFDVSSRMGTHGIGHTRFATESGVDRYHAHPYQSYIIPDITVVHNGQITNYWKIRDPLERKGHTFESFNDTECIVHYMADKLDQGYKLEEALDQAVIDLDGPFSILVGTPNGIGIAKDKLGLRPGVMVENEDIFAIASEEMALHDVVDSDEIEQIAPGETRAYTI